MSFQDSRLWQSSFGSQLTDWRQERERLRSSFLRFRSGVAVLAAEIHSSLPDYTVHDITHLDALWGVADTIVGDEYELTPLETFVLGGAFLLHDLGMGLAAWPGRGKTLSQHTRWNDTIASLLRRSKGRAPTKEEVGSPPPVIVQQATVEMLRLLHAEHAERLPDCEWRDDETGIRHVLLEDEHLRFHLGPVIGRIAHSHWWDATRLPSEFAVTRSAPSGFPKGWTIDALKVASVLRVADAAHLDDRRAPRLLRAARELGGLARSHWVFQGHLAQVRRDGDRLAFTATRPFSMAESDAWWLAFETIQMVDRELGSVDAVLAESDRPRLAARSVRGSDSPDRFSALVPVSGWQPVIARVRVGDVPTLVERLGGKQLYGEDPTVPLRELIQNAADAIKARRALEGRAADWGSITVRLVAEAEGTWLEVEDNGLGMSRAVLTGPLLDFGESYWTSSLCREEHPSLPTSGFEPIGRFGVGFFSVFMYGDRVVVTSRPFDAAQVETYSLEFRTGVGARPVLRQEPTKRLREGGSRVRILLKHEPRSPGGMLHFGWQRERGSLADLCRWIAPALEVDLWVEEADEVVRVIVANDWETMDAEQLLRRLNVEDQLTNGTRDHAWLAELADSVRPLWREGKMVGRCAVLQGRRFRLATDRGRPSAIVVGGLRADNSQELSGILVAEPERADRTDATPVVDPSEVARWASEQARIVPFRPILGRLDGIEVLQFLGGDVRHLPIAYHQSGWLNAVQLGERFRDVEEVLAIDLVTFPWDQRRQWALDDGVVAVDSRWVSILNRGNWVRNMGGGSSWPYGPQEFGDRRRRTLLGLVIAELAVVWCCKVQELVETSEFSAHKKEVSRRAGTVDGEPWFSDVHVLRRPAPPQ